MEDNTKIRDERILNLEARLDEAQVEIQALKKQLREVNKTVKNTKVIPAMKKIKQETPSHKATVIGDKLVVNGKVYFHYDLPKKWLPVNSSVNTHEDFGNGTADRQEPLQSKEESSDVMVQSQELSNQSE